MTSFVDLKAPIDWELPQANIEQYREKNNNFAVVIPVINEGERIRNQLLEMQAFCSFCDIIICDGGSTDSCTDPALMRTLGVTAVIRKTGRGRMSSQLRLLFAYALLKGYEGVVHMDGNGKDDPQFIPKHVALLKEGFDCVASSRYLPGGQNINTPLSRTLAIKLLHAPVISLAARRRFTDTTNSYRGYSAKMLSDARINPFRNIFDSYNLPYYLLVQGARLGFKVTEIPVVRRYPKNEVPSKIRGLSGRLGIIKELFYTVLGKYDQKVL